MEQPFSTSKVTVDYFDPHDVYKLLAPGLIPRLPLRNLNWQSHAGPLRSIETLHVELVDALAAAKAPKRQPSVSPLPTAGADDGFTTQALGGGLRGKFEEESFPANPFSPGYGPSAAATRRHQIPGLRRTPYLKVLFVRCDDNDSYKSSVRAEAREWVKEHTTHPPSANTGKKDARNAAENHDAFEWLIVHVVVPNTVAATQPRTSANGKEGSSETAAAKSSSSRWGKGSSTILEKFRTDFNPSSKADHIAQIRIGINDVPYDLLPRVVPAVPTGYSETEQDAKVAWSELVDKIKRLILSSFDMRVTQYEDDIKERDAMRNLPGWNFCTFFMLKEGLARGFESVGLIEDSLVGYDELSFGLDAIIQEQAAANSSGVSGGSLLAYTEDLKLAAQKAMAAAMAAATAGSMEFEDEESVDLQSKDPKSREAFDDIPISVFKKPYRELILANNVSIFDFRCYIFARQISLLLRQGNAMCTKEELVTKLKEQQESVLKGVAPRAPPPNQTDESENLSVLAEICKRTLEFIPAVSQVMRRDLIYALIDQKRQGTDDETSQDPSAHDDFVTEIAENIVASFAFSIAQQILAQTSTEALPIPPATVGPVSGDSSEPKASVPEPKTMVQPARSTSLRIGTAGNRLSTIPSPNFFPGPGKRKTSVPDMQDAVEQQSRKTGMIELASRRAELYALSRNILEEAGKKRGWSNGWSSAPMIGETGLQEMDDVNLDDILPAVVNKPEGQLKTMTMSKLTLAGLGSNLLRTALDNKEDFYRLYEMLTDKALRHYTVANHTHSVLASMSDLAVMKYYLKDYAAAASYFLRTTPFYGESGWSLLELSMLVMYSKCLREMKRNDEYVRVVLKLLSKAATSERERIQSRGAIKLSGDAQKDHPGSDVFKGFLPDFLDAAKSFDKDVKHSLQNFFTDVEVEGIPAYDDGQDSFSLTLRLRSVLADVLPVEKAMLRIVSAGGARELWLENTESLKLKPGRNRIQLRCNSMGPSIYEVDRIQLHSGALKLGFERQAFQPIDRHAVNLRSPYIVLVQRADTLDLKVEPATIVQLDRNNAMDLELNTGWNSVEKCDIRVRSATGGLRLLTADAHIVGDVDQPQPYTPEVGLFSFSDLESESVVRLRIPFTTEHDVASVSVKIEVKYTTENGAFTLVKTPSISLALKLGVNVQDVFKHAALYSRFTVSTSSPSPLRLFRSELAESEIFETNYGVPPGNPVIVFPKQPASLLYQIKRRAGVKISPKTDKIMHLRLFYSVLQDEIANNIRDSMTTSMRETPLWPYSSFVVSAVLRHVRNDLTAYDLERAAVLGELPTSFLAELNWQKHFYGLGNLASGENIAAALTSFIVDWTRRNHVIPSMRHIDPAEQQCILIPVDIPSMAVVHTADICLQRPIPSLVETVDNNESPVVCVNQLLPATLHLKWTRVWDTSRIDSPCTHTDEAAGNEFSYEVNAPGDTWLVGGRKKGHFVIPALSGAEGELSSSPIDEADIPLVLIPLREGWLPYPAVELREIPRSDSDAGGDNDGPKSAMEGHCETDYRNLGETVRVVADRGRVTVSLDASGPGGGPLVLESDRVLVGDAARLARVVG